MISLWFESCIFVVWFEVGSEGGDVVTGIGLRVLLARCRCQVVERHAFNEFWKCVKVSYTHGT
jgi:hypothetical protein